MPPSDPPAFGTAPGFDGYHHEREPYDAASRRVDPGARKAVPAIPRHDASLCVDDWCATCHPAPVDPRVHAVPTVARRAEVPSLHAPAGQGMRTRDPLHVGADPALMRAAETILASINTALQCGSGERGTYEGAARAIRAGVINGVTAAACDLYPTAQPPALAAIVAHACAELERITGQGGTAIQRIVAEAVTAAQGVIK